VGENYQRARLWAQKWRWYERNSLPWNRARIHHEFMRRQAFARRPLHGNVLETFREGRLEVGAHTLLEPHVWLTAADDARIRIGSGTFLNIAVMVAAVELVEIGDHCMFANGCFINGWKPPFRRPRPARAMAGLRQQGADPCGGQRLVRGQRGDHERGDGRRTLRDRGEQRGDRGPPVALDRGGGPGQGAARGGVPELAQQETIRWNGLFCALPLELSVRTFTPFTLDASAPTVTWPCGGPAAPGSPTVAT